MASQELSVEKVMLISTQVTTEVGELQHQKTLEQ